MVRPDNPENIADIGSVPDNMELIPDPNPNNGCCFGPTSYRLNTSYGSVSDNVYVAAYFALISLSDFKINPIIVM